VVERQLLGAEVPAAVLALAVVARVDVAAVELDRLARQAFEDLEETDGLIRRVAAWYGEGVSPDVRPAATALETAKSLLSRQRYEDSLKASAEANRLARESYAEATSEAERRRRRRQAQIQQRQLEDSFARMSRGFGPWVIRKLTELKIGQPIREYGMQSHLAKRGTPTMGGVLILIGIGVATLLWFDWSNRFVWVVMLVTFGFGAVGWVDDWRKVVHKNPEGMRSREKFFWQSLIGIVAAAYLAFAVSESTNLRVLELFLRWVQKDGPLIPRVVQRTAQFVNIRHCPEPALRVGMREGIDGRCDRFWWLRLLAYC
jgi:hypothetical protein